MVWFSQIKLILIGNEWKADGTLGPWYHLIYCMKSMSML